MRYKKDKIYTDIPCGWKVYVVHSTYGDYEVEGCNVEACYLVEKAFNHLDLNDLNFDYEEEIRNKLQDARNDPSNMTKYGRLKTNVDRKIRASSTFLNFLDGKLTRIDFME